jgi:uncharacterized protein with FMN-binding domain
VKKFFVSGFVVFTFVAYALHERLSDQNQSGIAPTQSVATAVLPTAGQLALTAPQPPTADRRPTAAPQPPTAVPPTTQPPTPQPPTTVPQQFPPVASSGSRYNDGQYVGQVVDAYYGLVKVQATIQNGALADVEFLEYPNDRRTSIRINTIAMPMLKSEAIQAQSADVDIISGATLTSEAFSLSLESALQSAKA